MEQARVEVWFGPAVSETSELPTFRPHAEAGGPFCDDGAVIQCIYIPLTEMSEVATVRAQVMKWGNSLAVRIPKSIAEEAKLRAGDPLEIEVAEQGCVHLQRTGKVPSLAELVSQITPENRYPEISTGPEVGKESVEW